MSVFIVSWLTLIIVSLFVGQKNYLYFLQRYIMLTETVGNIVLHNCTIVFNDGYLYDNSL
jgi:hypothetical protein